MGLALGEKGGFHSTRKVSRSLSAYQLNSSGIVSIPLGRFQGTWKSPRPGDESRGFHSTRKVSRSPRTRRACRPSTVSIPLGRFQGTTEYSFHLARGGVSIPLGRFQGRDGRGDTASPLQVSIPLGRFQGLMAFQDDLVLALFPFH